MSLASHAQTFLNPLQIATKTPGSVFIADFNQDGRPDILYGVPGDGNDAYHSSVHLLLATSGGYHETSAITLPSPLDDHCQVGDFNGDGKPDFVCIGFDLSVQNSNAPVTVAFYAGDGSGGFAAPVLSVFTGTQLSPDLFLPATGDLNGDGHLDLVLTDPQSPRLATLLGDGAGRFSLHVVSSFVSGSFDAFVADVNGDGHPDILTTGGFESGSVLLGDGSGIYQPTQELIDLSQYMPADADGDRRLDLISGTGGRLRIFRGNGDGSFSSTPLIDVNYASAQDTSVYVEITTILLYRDLNGDGIPDVLAGSDDGLSVILGKGNLQFAAPVHYPVAHDFFASNLVNSAIAVADMNGDGSPDIVTGGPDGVWITYGTRQGTFRTGSVSESGSVVGYAAVADFNGDGIPDVATTGDPVVHVKLGNGDGTFGPARDLPSGGADFSTPLSVTHAYIVHGDFNGDGRQDLIAVGSPGIYDYEAYLFLGRGDGSFANPVLVPGMGVGSGGFDEAPAVADIDADGRDDVYRTDGNGLKVFLGQTDGNFRSVTFPFSHTPTPSTGNGVVLPFADFNNDGIPDSAYCDSTQVQVLLGTGGAQFAAGPTVAIPEGGRSNFSSAGPLTTGDYDGDGNLDIALAQVINKNGLSGDLYDNGVTQIVIFYGDGHGGFSNGVAGPLFPHIALNAISADLDGDGRTDLIVSDNDAPYAGPGGPVLGIAHGRGDRTPSPLVEYIAGTGLSSLFAVDVNGDGRLDLLTANGDYNATANALTLLLNEDAVPAVTGRLTAEPEPSPVGQSFHITATLTPPRNASRNTGTTSDGTLSGTVVFTVDGGAAGTAELAGNVATVTVRLPGALAAGSHGLGASWAGSAAYAPLLLRGHHLVGTPASTSPPAKGTDIILTGSPNPAAIGQLVTLQATLTPLPDVGSVMQFVDESNGNAVLGQGAIDASGMTRFSTSTLTLGTHAIVARLSPMPPSNEVSNILKEVIVAPAPAPAPPPPPSPPQGTGDFSLVATPATSRVYTGVTASLAVSSTATGGFNGTVALSCQGLPAAAQCTFAPASIASSGGTAKLTIATTAPGPPAGRARRDAQPWWPGDEVALAVCVPLLPWTRRRKSRLALLLLVTSFGLLGCGAPVASGGTPPGTYTITIVGQSGSGTGILVRKVQVTLLVRSLF